MNALLRFEWLGAEAVVERLGWVLVHSLWQFALVALLAGVTVRAMRRSSSALRYGVLVTAMAVSVVAPIASWMLIPSDAPSDHSANRAASAPGHETIAATSPGTEATWLASKPAIAGDAEIEGPIPDLAPTSVASELLPAASPLSAGNTQPTPSWSVRAKAVLQPWLAWIVAGWSLGVVLCSARPLLGWHTLRRLKRVGVSPVSDEVLAALHLASERLGLRGSVQLLQSTLAQVPIVVGYFRPVILLPISLMTSIPAAQLEAILTHELAHIQRHDFVVNLLQTLIETFFFYHPAVWWLSRQIRVEREHCCDDLVVASFGNRIEYGRALLAIEELRGRSSVLALSAADGSLLSRIRRIVGLNTNGAANSPWFVLCLITCCFGAICGMSVLGWQGLTKANPDESQTLLVVEWFAVVDDGLVQEIRALKPTAGEELPATGAETIRRTSDELRAIVKKHRGDPAQVLLSRHPSIFPPSAPAFRPTGIAHSSGFAQHVKIGDHPVSVSHDGVGFYFIEERNNAAGVRLKMQYSFGVGSTHSGKVPVNLDTDIAPGEAIVNVIGLKPGAEWQASMIMVHEAIRVPANQVEFFKPFAHLDDWIRLGSAGMKQRVVRAAAWQSKAKRDASTVDPAWTRNTRNGGHVQLVAISRPKQAPMIWWDPEGRSISGIDHYPFTSTSHADEDIVALVRIWEDGVRRNLHDPGGTRSGNGTRDLPDRADATAGSQLVTIPAVLANADGRQSLKIGAGFGVWTAETELKADRDATARLGDLTVRTAALFDHSTIGKTTTLFRWTPTRDFDLTTAAVTKNGKVVASTSNPTVCANPTADANEPPNPLNSGTFFDHPLLLAEIDHFLVKSRPFHWTEFTGFAVEPTEPLDPPLDFTKPDDEQAANASVPAANEVRFTDELRLELKRGAAHGGRWFFVDLDRGRIVKPPFAVDIETERLPYFVTQPKEAELNEWLKQEGIDLILFSEAKPLGDGSGRMNQHLQTRSVRTNLAHLASGLQPRRDGSWTWKAQPSDVVAPFVRKDETTHVSGFVPNSSDGELRQDSPNLHAFRTAENVLGLFLLEQPNALKDELTLRIVHVANSTTPLADVQFATGDFVSGKNGPAEPPPGQPPGAKPDAWGPESNGLRARVVPVLSSMSEDAIDPAQRVTKFAKADDVAFVVELENVGDKPIKLVDLWHDAKDGKPIQDAGWLSQLVCSVVLFDRDGKRIEQPEIEVEDPLFILHNAQVATLQPGKTQQFLIKTVRWLPAFMPQIQAGSYRVAVRYHWLSGPNAARIRESHPKSSLLEAAAVDLVSAAVAIEVGGESRQPDLVWGKAINGLRAALSFEPSKGTHTHGERLVVNLHLQNVGTQPLKLVSDLELPDANTTIKNDKGEIVDLDVDGGLLSPRLRGLLTLKPQQTAVLDAGYLGVAITEDQANHFDDRTLRKLIAPAGKYSMQLEASFKNVLYQRWVAGQNIVKDAWVGKLKTGATPLIIAAAPVVGVRGEVEDKPAEIGAFVQVDPPPVVGDFSKVDDPDVLLDQLAKSQLPNLVPQSGGGFFQQPGAPPQAMYVGLWETQYAGNDKLDPRIRRLIELGDRAVPRVHQRLNGLVASDLLATHLTLVLRSVGGTESVPVLIKLLKTAPNTVLDGTQSLDDGLKGFQASVTQVAATSALWKLTGRKHIFTPDQWEKWWQSVKPDFVVPRDRKLPEFVLRVTPERVNALANDLATNEAAARERLIAIGPLALPHLLKVLAVTELLREPDTAPQTDAALRRLAWVIDELGATDKLPAKLRREYFERRFADGGTHVGSCPIDEDAFCRALSHCSFAEFCSICLAAPGRSDPLGPWGWMHMNSVVFSRRFEKQPGFVVGDPANFPLWNRVTPAAKPQQEVADAVPVLIAALNHRDINHREMATKLADIVGLCSNEKPEALIVALRDRWLTEPEANVRVEMGSAMSRFASPSVNEAVLKGLRSERLDILGDAAAFMDGASITLNDTTRSDFERLVELTRHENDRIRRCATRSLAYKAPQLLGPEFERLCTDKVKDIREACTLALRSNPDPKHADILFKLADDAEQTIRESAFSSIGNLIHPPSMKRLLPHLRDKKVHGYAVSALASMGGQDALPLMMTELESGNDIGGMVYQHLRRLTGEGFEKKPEPWLAWWKKNKPAPAPDKDSAANAPPDGLDFLKPYPKLHGLSLDMTEPQFLELVKQQELKTRKTVDGEKVTHHIALGDDHTLIVMFDKDAKCSGIRRVRGEGARDTGDSGILITYDIPGAEVETKVFMEHAAQGAEAISTESPLKNGNTLERKGLAAGDYNVARSRSFEIARAESGARRSGVFLDYQRVKLEPGQTKTIHFKRSGAKPATGRVRGWKELGIDVLVAYVCSKTPNDPRDFTCRDVTIFDARNCDSDGSFKTEPLAPGEYIVVVQGFEPLPRQAQDRTGDIVPRFVGTAKLTIPAAAEPQPVELTLHDALAGRASAALDPTAGLPNSDDETKTSNNVNGDLRSKPAAGSGDPRRAQEVFKPLECELVDAVTGQPIAENTRNVNVASQRVSVDEKGKVNVVQTTKPLSQTLVVTGFFHFIKPKSGDAGEKQIAVRAYVSKSSHRITLLVPDEIMRRADRDELLLDWRLGKAPVYENYEPIERIPLKQLLSDDPKSGRDSFRTIKLTPKKKTAEAEPPVGLEFLKPYLKLHGLSLDMTEPQFLELVKQQELKTRKTVECEKITHHIALGDGQTQQIRTYRKAPIDLTHHHQKTMGR